MKVNVLLRAPSAVLRLLRRDAHWRQTSLTAAIGSGIGLVNDVFSPIAQFYALMFGAAATVFALSFLRWRKQRQSGVSAPRQQKRRAKTAMASLIFAVSILPFWMLNGANREEGGTLAALVPQVQDAQQAILGELSIIRQTMEQVRAEQQVQTEILQETAAEQERQGETLTDIAESAARQEEDIGALRASNERQEEDLGALRDSSERQEGSLTGIEDLMSVSVALERLAQATAERDGTDIGQTEAVQALLAQGRRLQGRDFSGIALRDLQAQGIDLSKSPLHFTDLSGANLKGAILTEAKMKFTDLSGGAALDGANLTNIESHFLIAPDLDLQGADLSSSQFIGADFKGANFAGANLRNTRFLLSDFEGANFENADLTGAIFLLSRLTGATLKGAELSETMLDTSFVDDDALDRDQLNGTCRRYIGEARIDVYENIGERFDDPSDRDGYRYNWFSPNAYFLTAEERRDSLFGWPYWEPRLYHSASSLCESTFDDRGLVSTYSPLDFRLRLDRSYLGQRDRRAFVRSHYAEHYRRMLKTNDSDQLFKGVMAPQRKWITTYKKALGRYRPARGTAFSVHQREHVLAALWRADAYEPSTENLGYLTDSALKEAPADSELAALWTPNSSGNTLIGGTSDAFPFYLAPTEAAEAYRAHVVKTAPAFRDISIHLDIKRRSRRGYQVNPETGRNEQIFTMEIEGYNLQAPEQSNQQVSFHDGSLWQNRGGSNTGPFNTLPESVIDAMEGRGGLFTSVRSGQLFIVLDDWRSDEIAALPTTLTSEQIRTLRELSVNLDYRIGRTLHRDPDNSLLIVEGKLTGSDIVIGSDGLPGQ
ncbi:MAG: pentapeptide repeat-containing protein [Pseudomonadota bacterium]